MSLDKRKIIVWVLTPEISGAYPRSGLASAALRC